MALTIMPEYGDAARAALGNIDYVLANEKLSENSKEALNNTRGAIQRMLQATETIDTMLMKAIRNR